MKFALTIGAYRLLDFIHLGICQLQKVFPGEPILVSDDQSERSPHIAELATKLGATYAGSNSKRGHFSGDLQALLNAVQFARAHECEWAVKVSQRFIFKNPAARQCLLEGLSSPSVVFGLPGRLDPKTLRPFAAHGFTKLPCQTDLLVLRVDGVDPEVILSDYRKKMENIHYAPHGTFIEGLASDLFHGRFKDRATILHDFTAHLPGREGGDLYLRRNQNHDYDYRALAREHGINGDFNLEEWAQLEKRGYWPYPRG